MAAGPTSSAVGSNTAAVFYSPPGGGPIHHAPPPPATMVHYIPISAAPPGGSGPGVPAATALASYSHPHHAALPMPPPTGIAPSGPVSWLGPYAPPHAFVSGGALERGAAAEVEKLADRGGADPVTDRRPAERADTGGSPITQDDVRVDDETDGHETRSHDGPAATPSLASGIHGDEEGEGVATLLPSLAGQPVSPSRQEQQQLLSTVATVASSSGGTSFQSELIGGVAAVTAASHRGSSTASSDGSCVSGSGGGVGVA